MGVVLMVYEDEIRGDILDHGLDIVDHLIHVGGQQGILVTPPDQFPGLEDFMLWLPLFLVALRAPVPSVMTSR
jgi:hypothetical protein